MLQSSYFEFSTVHTISTISTTNVKSRVFFYTYFLIWAIKSTHLMTLVFPNHCFLFILSTDTSSTILSTFQ